MLKIYNYEKPNIFHKLTKFLSIYGREITMNIIQTVIKRLFLFWQVSSLGTIFKLATQDGSVVSKVLQTVTL